MILRIPNPRLWLGNSPEIPMALFIKRFLGPHISIGLPSTLHAPLLCSFCLIRSPCSLPNGRVNPKRPRVFLWSVAEDETTPPLRTCTSGSIFFEALGFTSNTNPMLPPYIQPFEECLSMSKNCPSCASLQCLRHQMVKGVLHRHNSPWK